MAANSWLVKSEPESYSWQQLVQDGKTAWTGVRNFQARNNLRAMKKGDLVFFYHSVTGKEIVGIARVARAAYPDPLAQEGDWSAVDFVPVETLARPVTLEMLKTDPSFKEMALLRQSRWSVTSVSAKQFKRVCSLGGSKL